MQEEYAQYYLDGNRLMVLLPSEVDDHTCQFIREEILEYLEHVDVEFLVFDFSDTLFMDSSGIGMIISCCRRIRKKRGQMSIQGESGRIKRLLRLSGIYQLAVSMEGEEK
ncbi:MAG: STAS domain-containing protein [Lachnospiraceae bacterium]